MTPTVFTGLTDDFHPYLLHLLVWGGPSVVHRGSLWSYPVGGLPGAAPCFLVSKEEVNGVYLGFVEIPDDLEGLFQGGHFFGVKGKLS